LKNTREIFIAIASSKPKVVIDAVQANGDVSFHIKIKECSLDKVDLQNPIVSTPFFVNFLGELLVRENVNKFAEILVGLDTGLYNKMVCSSSHTDFGMLVDHKISTITMQMHISLVQEIMTEFDNSARSDMELLPGEEPPPISISNDDAPPLNPNNPDDCREEPEEPEEPGEE
jgi:hypothetical protein